MKAKGKTRTVRSPRPADLTAAPYPVINLAVNCKLHVVGRGGYKFSSGRSVPSVWLVVLRSAARGAADVLPQAWTERPRRPWT